jgi:hypothetical protein
MKFLAKAVLVLCCVLPLCAPLAAQYQRDPLNDMEADQLREAAQEPYKRLKLMIKFASERLDTAEATQKEADPRGRGQRVHDSLEDFRSLIDELDDNIDDFVDKQQDLRKPLKEVVGAEESFETRLKAMKELGQQSKFPEEYKQYNFTLDDAQDAVKLSLEDAKKTLEQQSGAGSKK